MGILNISDKNFPADLKKITPKVTNLYFKGRFRKNIFEKSLTVVGSRKMTHYGQRIIENLLPPLVESGVTVISGFMYGVDQQAHKITLQTGGMTIAVLGWGIDWQVEEADKKLYWEIESKGLILSEYPAGISPQLWMFPRRNRIMAGAARAVLVIEAALNSGSLITATYARKYNKKLYAVPGPATSAVSQATNKLIKEGQAKMVTEADDILTDMHWTASVEKSKVHHSPGESDLLLNLLANQPLTIDEIALSLKTAVEKVSVRLSLLQLKGKIVENDGKYYYKIE